MHFFFWFKCSLHSRVASQCINDIVLVEQDIFSQYCTIKGIAKCTKAKQILGLVRRVVVVKNLVISTWDTASVSLLTATDPFHLDIANHVVHTMHQLDLRHYTLSVVPLNAIHAKGNQDEVMVHEGIMGSDNATLSSKLLWRLIHRNTDFDCNFNHSQLVI